LKQQVSQTNETYLIRNQVLKMTASPTAYTVYTKPDCPSCDKTKAYFDANGIAYTEVDITRVPAALEYITQELGYTQAPVDVSMTDDEDHWAGLRRDKLVQALMNHTGQDTRSTH
jgi:glutaredoxin-like protein NrdH